MVAIVGLLWTACQSRAGGDGGTVEAGDTAADAQPDDAGERRVDAGRLDAGPGDAGPRDAGAACHDRFPCETEGEVCMRDDGGTRCTCKLGAGTSWFCESAHCPAEIRSRDPCDMPHLRCGQGFEDRGWHCVSPENVWVRCVPWQADETAEILVHCPPEPPTEGALCCVDSPLDVVGAEPEPCPYDDDSAYLCRDHHWTRVD